MNYFQKQFYFSTIRIGIYQEPARIGLSVIYDRGDEKWGERALLSIRFLIWEIDFEVE
jgi:hypothetical protein